MVLGLALGTEREVHGHPAGMRTMALIGAGAGLFTAIGLVPAFGTRVDPTRIAAQIVTGVGFLGAGSILRQGEEVRGLTTAASIWVTASIGMAGGFALYGGVVSTTPGPVNVRRRPQPFQERVFPLRPHRTAEH